MTDLVVCEVDLDLVDLLLHDRLDEQARPPDVELIVDRVPVRILGELDVVRPEDGHPIDGCLPEGGVPDGEERVTKAKHVADVALMRLLEQVRLPSLGVDVGVRAEERHERPGLVPPDEEVGRRVL